MLIIILFFKDPLSWQ